MGDINASLENVKDKTAQNSPLNKYKQINQVFVQHREDMYGDDNNQAVNQNETGILRYSNAQQNTTAMLQKQRRPFEEIMKRRELRELITGNLNELGFSSYTTFDVTQSEDSESPVEDHLYYIQQEILEELILRKETYHVVH